MSDNIKWKTIAPSKDLNKSVCDDEKAFNLAFKKHHLKVLEGFTKETKLPKK